MNDISSFLMMRRFFRSGNPLCPWLVGEEVVLGDTPVSLPRDWSVVIVSASTLPFHTMFSHFTWDFFCEHLKDQVGEPRTKFYRSAIYALWADFGSSNDYVKSLPTSIMVECHHSDRRIMKTQERMKLP